MNKKKPLHQEKLMHLYEGVLTLKSAEECEAFFRDLCTMSELQDMSERFEVARLIDQKVPYREICERTGVSTATITRVAHWLKHGEGGYRSVIDRL